MQVHPNQLVPGCILLKPVQGKSTHPIMPNHTIIEEKHIEVLLHFGIEKIEVSEHLASGTPFQPKEMGKKVDKETLTSQEMTENFETMYTHVVAEFKKIFLKWQSGAQVNIFELRKLMEPIYKSTDTMQLDLFLLHKYASKEDYFYHHCIAVSLISAYLAKKIGYTKEWIQIGLAGLLADSGMSKLDQSIMQKENSLSIREYDEIKKHPTYSYRMVEHTSGLTKEVKLSILQHHERLDGSGYPLGVKEDKIHPFAKIIAISDTYHAMTSERYYREKQSPFKVIEQMLILAYTKFDYVYLQTFAQTLLNYAIGTKVLLSNGQEAVIVYAKTETPIRPIIRIIETDEIIALKDKPTLFIENIIESKK
ncbi:HD-GYP domain-containing protein [Gracilibacillus marinus]|jgi:HD-GYP domain-containing protein (c-di-GMP phosphodiesterase class II)|uniref:HD-GYP domain-containing protein n=1 Tax=Gracilibacillus marinus TaxID=630535 RepID=A0ABV8VVN2_9BACI